MGYQGYYAGNRCGYSIIMKTNWYKIAKKTEKKPYKIVVIKLDKEWTPQELQNVRKEAYSSEQARMIFIKNYPFLKDYYQIGYDVEARLDKEEYQRRQDVAKSSKEMEDKQIQNAWWNQ